MIEPKNPTPRRIPRHRKGWLLWKIVVTEFVKAGGQILTYYTWVPPGRSDLEKSRAKLNIKYRFNFDYKRDRNAWVDMEEPTLAK